MSAPKVYADFQNLDDFNRLRLTCAGTVADLARQGIELREGLILTFCMDDADDQGQPDELLAEGVAHFDPEARVWVASIDWSAVRHASEERLRILPAPNASNGVQAQKGGRYTSMMNQEPVTYYIADQPNGTLAVTLSALPGSHPNGLKVMTVTGMHEPPLKPKLTREEFNAWLNQLQESGCDVSYGIL